MCFFEYTNPFPAKLIIEKGKIYTENANKTHGNLQLQPNNFSPFPKNPVIARVFKEIGRADELGSGVRNIFEYYNFYAKQEPVIDEKDIFKCTVFIDAEINDDVPNVPLNDRMKYILKEIELHKTINVENIAKTFNVSEKTIKRDIN